MKKTQLNKDTEKVETIVKLMSHHETDVTPIHLKSFASLVLEISISSS